MIDGDGMDINLTNWQEKLAAWQEKIIKKFNPDAQEISALDSTLASLQELTDWHTYLDSIKKISKYKQFADVIAELDKTIAFAAKQIEFEPEMIDVGGDSQSKIIAKDKKAVVSYTNKYEKYERGKVSMIRVEKEKWQIYQDAVVSRYDDKKMANTLVKRFMARFASASKEEQDELIKYIMI